MARPSSIANQGARHLVISNYGGEDWQTGRICARPGQVALTIGVEIKRGRDTRSPARTRPIGLVELIQLLIQRVHNNRVSVARATGLQSGQQTAIERLVLNRRLIRDGIGARV